MTRTFAGRRERRKFFLPQVLDKGTTQESGHVKRPKRAVDKHRKTIKDDLLLFVIFVA